MNEINPGVYPTMITPYNRDGSVDLGAVGALTEWYWEKGCHGVFAVCMSSEMFRLTLREKRDIVRTVKNKADSLRARTGGLRKMSVVASGHTSDGAEEQIKELCAAADAGADSAVLITNRADRYDCDDGEWIRQTERVISGLPSDITLGFYECPYPAKRLISDRMLEWMKTTGRVAFIKDTCCDIGMMRHRLDVLRGSGIGLFNANAQTLLPSLRAGAAGFSGVMGNFNPEVLVSLYECFGSSPERAERIQDYITVSCVVEGLRYPLGVKYLLKEHAGIGELIMTRAEQDAVLTDYDRECLESCYRFNEEARVLLGIRG